MSDAVLSLGPVLFAWAPAVWRDFYFRVADEAAVDEVYLGEVVCAKRSPGLAPHMDAVVERLTAAGKTVVRSTPILVTSEAERADLRAMIEADVLVEANDLGAVALLGGVPHRVGPSVNVYNEGTLRWAAKRGARVVALNPELPRSTVVLLAAAGADAGIEVEVQIFGRMPLAISARCYHARAHGLPKDACRHVCGADADGLPVATLDGQAFLVVNGTQTLSDGCLELAGEIAGLREAGVRRFRLSPQSVDMVRIAGVYRAVIDGDVAFDAAAAMIAEAAPGFYHVNGYINDLAGAARV